MPHVFVFGALMRRAEGRSEGRAGVVRDHEVNFLAPGVAFLEPSFAALVPCTGRNAHGVLYELSAAEWEKLRSFEPGYQETRVTVEVGCVSIPARALMIPEGDRLSSPLVPSRRYLRILLEGARQHELPSEWIAELEGLESKAPRLTSHLSFLMKPVISLVPYFGGGGAILLVGILALLLLFGLIGGLSRYW